MTEMKVNSCSTVLKSKYKIQLVEYVEKAINQLKNNIMAGEDWATSKLLNNEEDGVTQKC